MAVGRRAGRQPPAPVRPKFRPLRAWAPDGRLLFDNYDVSRGVDRLFVTAWDGRGQRNVTPSPGVFVRRGDAYPGAWSPDGTRIAYTIDRSLYGGAEGSDIVVARADGSHAVRITDSFPEGSDNRVVSWVPGHLAGTRRHFVTVSVRRRQVVFRDAIYNFASDRRASVAMIGVYGEGTVLWRPRARERWRKDLTCGWRNAGIADVVFSRRGAVWRCSHQVSVLLRADDLRRHGTTQVIVGWRKAGRQRSVIGTLSGGGSLLVYERGINDYGDKQSPPPDGLFRLSGRRSQQIPHSKGLSLLDVAQGVIAAKAPNGSVALLRPNGVRVRTLLFSARAVTAARIAGKRLAVVDRGRLRLLDTVTGATIARLALRRGEGPPPVLSGVQGGLAVYTAGVALHLLRISDGRDVILRTPKIGSGLEARLGPRGLIYVYNAAYSRYSGRLQFVPWHELLRALAIERPESGPARPRP